MLTQCDESEKLLKLWALALGMAITVSKGEVTQKARVLVPFLILAM